MLKILFIIFSISSQFFFLNTIHAEVEANSPSPELLLTKITGKPIFDSPKLLNWPLEHGDSSLNISEPTSNILHDFHGDINDCEMSLSTQGSFHSALAEIWPKYLALFPKTAPLKDWFYFGGIPVAEKQISSGFIQVGNFKVRCKPQVVIVNLREITKLKEKGYLDNDYIPFAKVRSYVLLVKKRNQKKIKTIWDLARSNIRVVTPSPIYEPGSFAFTLKILHRMAQLDKLNSNGISADQFIDKIFNTKNNKKNIKWLAVSSLTHRGVPWSIAYGRGDVSLLPYQMAKDIVMLFPNLFEIIELRNGKSETLFPTYHNADLFIARIKGNWTNRQKEAQKKLVDILLSSEFTTILSKYGLDRVH